MSLDKLEFKDPVGFDADRYEFNVNTNGEFSGVVTYKRSAYDITITLNRRFIPGYYRYTGSIADPSVWDIEPDKRVVEYYETPPWQKNWIADSYKNADYWRRVEVTEA